MQDTVINKGIFHKGLFDHKTNDSILKECTGILQKEPFSYKISKRIYTVIEECLTNLHKHTFDHFSHDTGEDEYPSYIKMEIKNNQNEVLVSCGNIVSNEDKKKLESIIDYINHSDKIAIKKLYQVRLREENLSAKGGANLGLITIGRMSEQHIHYHFEDVCKDCYYFTMKITICV
jgi:hypothetical protein